MWHQWFSHNFMKLWEYFLCAKKTNIIMTWFSNFFFSLSVFDAHSWEYHDAWVWCCWRRSRHSDVERPSLFVHRLYILVQIRLGKKLQAILSVEIFRHVYECCFMYRVHLPLLVNKAQRIQVLHQNTGLLLQQHHTRVMVLSWTRIKDWQGGEEIVE